MGNSCVRREAVEGDIERLGPEMAGGLGNRESKTHVSESSPWHKVVESPQARTNIHTLPW